MFTLFWLLCFVCLFVPFLVVWFCRLCSVFGLVCCLLLFLYCCSPPLVPWFFVLSSLRCHGWRWGGSQSPQRNKLFKITLIPLFSPPHTQVPIVSPACMRTTPSPILGTSCKRLLAVRCCLFIRFNSGVNISGPAPQSGPAVICYD